VGLKPGNTVRPAKSASPETGSGRARNRLTGALSLAVVGLGVVAGTLVATRLIWPAAPRQAQVANRGEIALSPRQLYAAVCKAVVCVESLDGVGQPIGSGTGFFVSADGLVVTNLHVIRGATDAVVRSGEGQDLKLEGVVAADERLDLAVLKVAGSPPAVLRLAAAQPAVGERVFAVGHPLGLTNTFSEGMISGVRQRDERVMLLQTTTPISPGSSGGPLVSSTGRVVGVTTCGANQGQNLNFALSGRHIGEVLAQRGEPRPVLSAAGESVPDELAWGAAGMRLTLPVMRHCGAVTQTGISPTPETIQLTRAGREPTGSNLLAR
jgi:S1-C subfamily serine protease